MIPLNMAAKIFRDLIRIRILNKASQFVEIPIYFIETHHRTQFFFPYISLSPLGDSTY